MKKQVLIIIVLLISTEAFTQIESPEFGYLGISFGISNSAGQYSRNNKTIDGFSTSGYNIKFDWNTYIKNNFSITGTIGTINNKLQTSIANANIDTLTEVNFNTNRRNNWYVMAGPCYSLTLKNAVVDIRTVGGLMLIPKYDWDVTFSNDVTYSKYKTIYYTGNKSESASWKFSYGAGVNLRYNITESIQAIMGVEYITSVFKLNSKSELYELNHTQMTEKYYTTDSKVGVVNITCGVGFTY